MEIIIAGVGLAVVIIIIVAVICCKKKNKSKYSTSANCQHLIFDYLDYFKHKLEVSPFQFSSAKHKVCVYFRNIQSLK